MRRTTLLPLLLCALAACRTVTGRDFDPAPIAGIEVGATTAAELEGWFGAADRAGTLRGPAGRTEVRYRHYAASDEAGARGRTLGVELADGVVRGFLYDSSLDGDATEFDAAARAELVDGASTREDAQALLGAPSGRFALPSNLLAQEFGRRQPEGPLEVWAWRSSVTTRPLGLLKTRVRQLALYFDADGVLVERRYRSDRD